MDVDSDSDEASPAPPTRGRTPQTPTSESAYVARILGGYN